jgi:hypothetical protein
MKHVKTVSHKRPAMAVGLGLKAVLAAIFFAKEGGDD